MENFNKNFVKVEDDGQTKLDFNLVDEESKIQKAQSFEVIGKFYIDTLNEKYPYAKISNEVFKCIGHDKFLKGEKIMSFDDVEDFFRELNEDYKPEKNWYDR